MIIFAFILALIAWSCLVLRTDKIHHIQYFDEYYVADTPLKFSDTIREHRRMKNDLKKLNKKHNNNG